MISATRGDEVTLDRKVAFLRRPGSYPEETGEVEPIETHMAWVFLTDEHAYKLKKPVRYAFLDFSTVEARRRDCEDEVRLNRRLAQDVYLRTVPLTLDPSSDRLELDGEGTPVEWLVQMRRLPANRFLERAIREGTVSHRDVKRAAGRLARFYRDAPPVEMTPSGYRARLHADVRENLHELSDPAFDLPVPLVERVCAMQLELVERSAGWFERRIRDGRIIEAHGDLRPEHICLISPPVVIDCLEFKREFRLLDPVDELAFLAMECEHLDAAWVGRIFFDVYADVTRDSPGEELVHFYKCYRATLRAKIAAWHTREDTGVGASEWTYKAKRYLRRAEGYARALGSTARSP